MTEPGSEQVTKSSLRLVPLNSLQLPSHSLKEMFI